MGPIKMTPRHAKNIPSLKLTERAPENGCLEDEISSWDPAYLFSGAIC